MTAVAFKEACHSFAQAAAPYLPIRDDAHYEEALELIESLLEEAEDSADNPINAVIDLLGHAIETYETPRKAALLLPALVLFDLIKNAVNGSGGKLALLRGCDAGLQKRFQLLQGFLLFMIRQRALKHIVLDGLALQGCSGLQALMLFRGNFYGETHGEFLGISEVFLNDRLTTTNVQ